MVVSTGGVFLIKKAILKASIFAIIVVFITSYLNSLFIIKTSYHSSYYQGLYSDIGDKYDVVLLGSSHMLGGISPNLLWHDYGMTSFNYASAGQPIDITYYLLKELLKQQKYPIVVVDLYYLGSTQKYGKDSYISNVLDNMKLSENKIEAIMACTPENQRASYVFPFTKYLNRWKVLTKADFKEDKLSDYFEKGFYVGQEKYGKENKADVFIKGVEELPAKSEEYLYKIINLSKDKGFKLVFINAPHDYTSTLGNPNWHQATGEMFNKVEEICKTNNVEFINYNKKLDEIGFDFKSDMYNNGHLNLLGSNKVTNHLAGFLKGKYSLGDHRDDKSYEQWNKDYLRYSQR